MLEADIARVQQRRHEVVVNAAQVQADVVVEEAHGELVQLLRHETDIFEVGGPRYLLDDAAFELARERLEGFLARFGHGRDRHGRNYCFRRGSVISPDLFGNGTHLPFELGLFSSRQSVSLPTRFRGSESYTRESRWEGLVSRALGCKDGLHRQASERRKKAK